MKCLCCNKEIAPGTADVRSGWHRKCVKRFFDTDLIPELNITDEELEKLANDTVSEGFTVPGVQKKLSIHLSKAPDREMRITLVDYPAGYILKPQAAEYADLPELEHLTMLMAELTGIKVAEHGLIRIGEPRQLAYITKRMDRVKDGDGYRSLAMEDFCQLSGKLTRDKYRSSYERVAETLMQYSAAPGLDGSELFMRLVFCFLTGNSDMHLKNFSLMENSPGSREYTLSPAYDLLPVNLILPEDKEETALTLAGRKTKLRRRDFMQLAPRLGLSEKTAGRLMDHVLSKKDEMINVIEEADFLDEIRGAFIDLINARAERLENS